MYYVKSVVPGTDYVGYILYNNKVLDRCCYSFLWFNYMQSRNKMIGSIQTQVTIHIACHEYAKSDSDYLGGLGGVKSQQSADMSFNSENTTLLRIFSMYLVPIKKF